MVLRHHVTSRWSDGTLKHLVAAAMLHGLDFAVPNPRLLPYDPANGRLLAVASIGFHIVRVRPGGRMRQTLTALRRGFDNWVGWKRLGIAASFVIIVIAAATLFHTLKGVNAAIILTALG